MLKLENIHGVTVTKDGQEAYDIIKTSVDEAIVYNLISMDVQLRNSDLTSPYHVLAY
jgi:hypothetical protein